MMNNELMYGYANDVDRDFMAMEMAVDIELDKVGMAMEMADRKYELAVKQSDLKVLTESGTYEDISTLYEVAAEENKEKKEGILSKAVNAIISFIQGIINKIKSLFGAKQQKAIKESNVETVSLPGNPEEHIKGLKGKLNELATFLKPGFHATDADGNKVVSLRKTIVTGLEAIGAGTAIAFGVKKLMRVFKGYTDVENQSNELMVQAQNQLSIVVDDTQRKVFNDAINGVKDVAASAKSGWQTVFKKAASVITGFGGAVAGTVKGVFGGKKGNKKADSNAKSDAPEKNRDGTSRSEYREMDSMDESAMDEFDTQSLLESCEDIIDLFD